MPQYQNFDPKGEEELQSKIPQISRTNITQKYPAPESNRTNVQFTARKS